MMMLYVLSFKVGSAIKLPSSYGNGRDPSSQPEGIIPDSTRGIEKIMDIPPEKVSPEKVSGTFFEIGVRV
jgi:hypothetical protein